MNMIQRCGFIALLGKPNAGKSTLLNALIGAKIAVVSRKPQTTRSRVLGVVTEHDSQLILLDTPGVHFARRAGRQAINAVMNRVAIQVATEANFILYLVDSSYGWSDEDAMYLREILHSGKAQILLIGSKTDAKKQAIIHKNLTNIQEQFHNLLQSLTDVERQRFISEEVLTASAKQKDQVTKLRKKIAEWLPAGPWLYEADDLTDMPNKYLCSELIREQLFRQLGDEIPYGCAVVMERIAEEDTMVRMSAIIVVNRKTHKGMVIGKAGSRIKQIGIAARQSLEQHFEKQVHLELNVRVEENWVEDQQMISELAMYGMDDE